MLFTLTGPTASGKTFLRDHLVDHHGFLSLVSTTTRPPRPDEQNGVEYYFIDKHHSSDLVMSHSFIEHFTYNGITYGITMEELNQKLNTGLPLLSTLTPEGVDIFRRYTRANSIEMKTVYVNTPRSDRIRRLNARTAIKLNDLKQEWGTWNLGKVQSLLEEHNGRYTATIGNEEAWFNFGWDIVVPGDNITEAVRLLKAEVV